MPGIKSYNIIYLSANTCAGDLDSRSIYISIYDVAGNIIGRKFRDSGHIGTIVIDYRLLYTIGPDKDKLRPREPKGVEIIKPSPQTLAKWKKFLPSILAYIFNFSTLFRISLCISN